MLPSLLLKIYSLKLKPLIKERKMKHTEQSMRKKREMEKGKRKGNGVGGNRGNTYTSHTINKRDLIEGECTFNVFFTSQTDRQTERRTQSNEYPGKRESTYTLLLFSFDLVYNGGRNFSFILLHRKCVCLLFHS